ncbi:MAG TPA: nucleoside triphosphate pyrophosphohydrolase [Candidatus Binataceae bacterium]|nr:nucleoside triphosphate pyrophosphohydrolase [Candidatus Binataceae bacterium]
MSRTDQAADEFVRLAQIVRELRERCPWDRQQTAQSLSKHLIEEAYETLDAIDHGSPEELADELGDLMVQVMFHTVLGEEQHTFDLENVTRRAADKLTRRHPHVYGDVKADSAEQVVKNWEQLKRSERLKAGAASALDGVGRALPALLRAEKLGVRARAEGLDWPDIHSVIAKVREELTEVEQALSRDDSEAAAAELGDALLALANAPRFLRHSAEETLRRACDKFVARFTEVEKIAASRELKLSELTPEQLDQLWNEAKAMTGKE